MMIEFGPAFARRVRLLCLVVIGSCLGVSAWAQIEPPEVRCGSITPPTSPASNTSGSSNTTLTTSCSRTPDTFTDNPLPDKRIDTYRTRLTGLLQGNATLFYDQEFAVPFGDAAVQAGVGAAMAALSSANSGNPLSFQLPSLTNSQSSLLGSASTTTVVGPPVKTETLVIEETIGSGFYGGGPNPPILGDHPFLRIGNRGLCSGLQASGSPSDCSPIDIALDTYFDFSVVVGTRNLNANLNYQYHFTRDVQRTETWELFETWTLIGVVDPGQAGVPEPGMLGLLLAGGVGLLVRRGPRQARRRN